MSDSIRDILRRAGKETPDQKDRSRFLEKADEIASYYDRSEDKTELEKRHDRYRQRQERASRLGPAVERLPILSREEQEKRQKERPGRRQIQFEGPIEKLIEKYKDPKEVFNHLSLGQLMKYSLDEETGCIYEKGKLIFDGQELVKEGGTGS